MPEPKEQPPAARATATPAPQPEPRPLQNGSTAGGLPKRSRKGSISIVPTPDSTPAPTRTYEETASIMGAFQLGTQSGRSAHREGHDPQ
jgi:hypothetical protein